MSYCNEWLSPSTRQGWRWVGARDTSGLEPQVCFFFFHYHFYMLLPCLIAEKGPPSSRCCVPSPLTRHEWPPHHEWPTWHERRVTAWVDSKISIYLLQCTYRMGMPGFCNCFLLNTYNIRKNTLSLRQSWDSWMFPGNLDGSQSLPEPPRHA